MRSKDDLARGWIRKAQSDMAALDALIAAGIEILPVKHALARTLFS